MSTTLLTSTGEPVVFRTGTIGEAEIPHLGGTGYARRLSPGPADSMTLNGTYHATELNRERQRRTRLLVVIGGIMAVIGIVGAGVCNADMTRLEQSGPERLALAGGGIDHFVPSILLNLPAANRPATTVTTVLEGDPRRSPAFINDKRALERWLMLAGLGLATLFIGLESTIPTSTATQRSPTGTDLSRMLILLALAYGGLSFFEG